MNRGLLYKYVGDVRTLEFILRGAVKFTPPHELNDPSELHPTLNLDAVQASLARLRQAGYTERDLLYLKKQGCILRTLAPQFQPVRTPQTPEEATTIIRSQFYDLMPRLELLLEATAREISSKVGLFCLSLRYDSLPMWAHYAGNATGLIVAFRNLESVFSGDDTGVLRQPVTVRYYREHVGMTFEPSSHEALFFEKFDDWRYEQEVRVVLPLADCRTESVSGKQIYLYDVPADCVTRVILGWNMSAANVAAASELIAEINPNVQVTQASFARGKVVVEPVISDGARVKHL
jgi:hypothetical protein